MEHTLMGMKLIFLFPFISRTQHQTLHSHSLEKVSLMERPIL